MLASSPTIFVRPLLTIMLVIWVRADGKDNTAGFLKQETIEGCKYNGADYNNGQSIPGICIDMTCVKGKWVTEHKFNSQCERCNLRNGPHITTFDNNIYYWHSSCNYSISQLQFGYNEKFGIYGQVQGCKNDAASCLHITTFKDNLNSVIEINHNDGSDVKVNGNGYGVQPAPEYIVAADVWHPIIAWRPDGWNANCNFFLGTQGYLLATCGAQSFLWAYPNLMNQINGLCGHYNGKSANDFTNRNGVQHPISYLPFAFPHSWLTADQTTKDCAVTLPKVPEYAIDECKAGPFGRMYYYMTCDQLFLNVENKYPSSSRDLRDVATYACIVDLCLMEQNRIDQKIIEEWKVEMQNMHLVNLIIDKNTV